MSDFSEKWLFSTDFRKNTHVSSFMKVLQVGTNRSMRTDGRTDEQTGRYDELIVTFRNFANAPKNESTNMYRI